MIVRARHGTRAAGGSWLSALALFAYAAGFSFAYKKLSAATGALLLFGARKALQFMHFWKRYESLSPARSPIQNQ
jgi:hypothetical protein